MRKLFRNILLDRHLISAGDAVLVALSGGPDSVALLSLFHAVAADFSLTLMAAHLDHGIRPESRNDARFVEALCRDWEIPLIIKRVDVPRASREQKKGLEEMARQLRRAFLVASACQLNCNRIALGHHRGDQAETLIHHLLRGVGPSGLAGMRIIDGKIIRPLLPISRPRILEYLDSRGISYLFDESNLDTSFTRNRIRQDVLPLLKTFNAKLDNQLSQLAQLVADEEDYWAALEENVLKNAVVDDKDGMLLDLTELRNLHPALRKRVIRLALRIVRGDLTCLSHAQVAAVEKLILSLRPASELHLNRCWVGRDYNRLQLRREKPRPPERFSVEVSGLEPVTIPGVGCFQALLTEKPNGENSWCTEFDADQIEFPLIVRSFLPGDAFQPMGMNGTKKLKDLFIDRKLHRVWRSQIPLVVAADKILWVIGMRRSKYFHPGHIGNRVLKLTFQPENAFKNLFL